MTSRFLAMSASEKSSFMLSGARPRHGRLAHDWTAVGESVSWAGRPRHARRSGFTLMEILIVAALISLLSGIAIFSINTFYNNSIRKAVIGETHQLATGLSFAHDDVQFFPRFNFLNAPPSLVLFNEATNLPDNNSVVSSLDYYGFLYPGGVIPILERIQTGWSGPYMGVSQTRDRSNRGGRSGIVKMRLPDVFLDYPSYSVVDWPADVWGNPYVFYQLRSGIDTSGNLIPEFIENQSEAGDFMTAVVSYGANRIPGGNDKTGIPPDGTPGDELTLLAGALYIEGDDLGGIAHFTLRVCTPDSRINPIYQLINNTPVHLAVLDSLRWPNPPGPNIDAGQVGMLDDGNDDIIYNF
jgi:prepilin-type N-terminal cleavage/methylation domain-containing protein